MMLAAVCLAVVSYGADTRVSWSNAGGDREFTNVDNWNTVTNGAVHKLPGYAPDTGNSAALIQSSGPVNLNSNFTPANDFDGVIVRSSQTLNINADLNVANVPLYVGQLVGHTDVINHSNGTVTASALTVMTDAGTYNMDGGTLNVSGITATSGTVNQAAGTIDLSGGIGATDAQFNKTGGLLDVSAAATLTGGAYHQSGGTSDIPQLNLTDATYSLSGGLLLPASNETYTVDGTGVLTIAGGVLTNANKMHFSGAGTIVQTGGLLTINQGKNPAQGVSVINADMEISGGTNIIHGQIYVGQGSPVEITVVGSSPVISWDGLNEAPASHYGTFKFVLDEDGVSPVNVVTWMSLGGGGAVRVDGTDFYAFTDGPTNITLLNSANYASLCSDVAHTNFHPAASLKFLHYTGGGADPGGNIVLEYTPPPIGTALIAK